MIDMKRDTVTGRYGNMLYDEINSTIDRILAENTLTTSEIIGVLTLIVADWVDQAKVDKHEA